MTALIARQPLQSLPMSSIQREPRRLSARLQGKDENGSNVTGASIQNGNGKATSIKADASHSQTNGTSNAKKRKNEYTEEDDGFAFTRVKKRKPRTSEAKAVPIVAPHKQDVIVPPAATQETKIPLTDGANEQPKKKRRNKMSFSTPIAKETQPTRRSKRLSNENDQRDASPNPKARRKENPTVSPQTKATEPSKALPKKSTLPAGAEAEVLATIPTGEQKGDGEAQQEEQHASTKIALPFADTPVIRRNKAMREGRGSKGERRSSLGLRGRRASSLIDSGSSNALPHNEVQITDFYKHIESEGLPEPRRMRQLLTWCATRALDQKPMGTNFEDSSARSAAIVIEEELLKDLSNRSELSDWFSRDDLVVQSKPIPERPNPKNVQNTEKIRELEEQIKRLRTERDALEALLQPPVIPESVTAEPVDRSFLSPEDAALLDSVKSNADLTSNIMKRLNSIQTSLGPTIDAFADGIQEIGQYRKAADDVASRILTICSQKLADREKEGRQKASQEGESNSPRRDLNSVLRGLSRVDR